MTSVTSTSLSTATSGTTSALSTSQLNATRKMASATSSMTNATSTSMTAPTSTSMINPTSTTVIAAARRRWRKSSRTMPRRWRLRTPKSTRPAPNSKSTSKPTRRTPFNLGGGGPPDPVIVGIWPSLQISSHIIPRTWAHGILRKCCKKLYFNMLQHTHCVSLPLRLGLFLLTAIHSCHQASFFNILKNCCITFHSLRSLSLFCCRDDIHIFTWAACGHDQQPSTSSPKSGLCNPKFVSLPSNEPRPGDRTRTLVSSEGFKTIHENRYHEETRCRHCPRVWYPYPHNDCRS